MSDPLVTIISFDSYGVTILVDRRERIAFLMGYDADHLGMFMVGRGRLLWFGVDETYPPLAIVRTVRSMIGGKHFGMPRIARYGSD